MLIAISVLLLGIGLCMCGWHLWRIYRRIFLLEAAVGIPSASHNRQSAPCLHVESLFVNKAGFDECRICGHVFRN